jgi:hypothetical protein
MRYMGAKEHKELPKEFEVIAERFANDYRLALLIHSEAYVKAALKSPVTTLLGVPKKESELLFQTIFSKVIENDKILNKAFKESKIETFFFKYVLH